MIGETFAADLLGAAALARGVDQLNAVGVDDAEHSRSGQEDLRPGLMGPEEAKEPGALRGSCTSSLRVIRSPANPVQYPFHHLCEGTLPWYLTSFSTSSR
jgi:hypothetical protein